VDRNFLKRLVRETFRRQRDKVAGFDLLVRPRRRLSADEFISAREELVTLLLAAIK
jgi:ribonuclease P protein component